MARRQNGRGISRRTVTLGLLASGAALASPRIGFAQAQTYPNRAVRIIVPFPAGGTADAMPRVVAEWLSRKWSQPVIIENRTGAAGNIGAEAFANADPDGYTLLSAPPPPLVINHNLYPKLGFDPTRFIPLAIMGRVPNTLLASHKVAAKSVPELIAYAKANPGKLTCATAGNGATQHLTAEMFQMMGQVKFQLVPYRGSAPALQDLVSGNVDLFFDNFGASRSLVTSGKIRLIAMATPKRLASMPEVPTIAETLPGFDSAAWFGVVAQPGTPQAIVTKLNADINEGLRDPEVRKRLDNLSAEVVGGSLQETAAYFKEEMARWHKVIKEANVQL
jgi:tripartite-type tricarboxylate transporter receptor subunit TctC